MRLILLLTGLFLSVICYADHPLLKSFNPNNIRQDASILPLVIGAIVAGVVAVAVGVYNYLQVRKMQKKNRPQASQMDGSISGEGTIVHDIAGSPHLYGNDVEKWGYSTEAIKQKSGKK